MQDKNVSHEINLVWFLPWCFWGWAPSSQSDAAVPNTNSALPPKGFTKDGIYESGSEPFLFLGQLVWPNTRQVSLLPRVTQFWWLWKTANTARAARSERWKGEIGLCSQSWAELWRICDVYWWGTHYLYSCISNCVWTLRSCKETGINPNVLNFISGNGQIRFKWLFKWLSWRERSWEMSDVWSWHTLSGLQPF